MEVAPAARPPAVSEPVSPGLANAVVFPSDKALLKSTYAPSLYGASWGITWPLIPSPSLHPGLSGYLLGEARL